MLEITKRVGGVKTVTVGDQAKKVADDELNHIPVIPVFAHCAMHLLCNTPLPNAACWVGLSKAPALSTYSIFAKLYIVSQKRPGLPEMMARGGNAASQAWVWPVL